MSKARLVITAVVTERRSQGEVARAYGVSQGWVSRLVARYRAEGEAAFEPRSRRPKTSPAAISDATVELITRLRKDLAGRPRHLWDRTRPRPHSRRRNRKSLAEREDNGVIPGMLADGDRGQVADMRCRSHARGRRPGGGRGSRPDGRRCGRRRHHRAVGVGLDVCPPGADDASPHPATSPAARASAAIVCAAGARNDRTLITSHTQITSAQTRTPHFLLMRHRHSGEEHNGHFRAGIRPVPQAMLVRPTARRTGMPARACGTNVPPAP